MLPPIIYLLGLFSGPTNGPPIFLYADTSVPDSSPEASQLLYIHEATEEPLNVLVSAPGSLP